MAQPTNPPISVRIQPLLLERLDRAAKANGISRNAVIVRALENALGVAVEDGEIGVSLDGLEAIVARTSQQP